MTEHLTSHAETCPDGHTMVAELREARWKNAERQAASEMDRLLTAADAIAAPKAGYLGIDFPDIPIWTHISASEQLALQAVGIDAQELLTGDDERRELAAIEGDGVRVDVLRDGGSLAYKLSHIEEPIDVDTDRRFNDKQKDAIRRRYQQSPGHVALHEALGKAWDGGELPEELTLPTFAMDDDPLGTLVLLTSLGVGGQDAIQYEQRLKQGTPPETMLAETIGNIRGTRTESDDFVRVTRHTHAGGSYVARTMFVDKHTRECTLSFRQVPERAYVETANQSSEAMSTAFIDTACAQQMIGALAEQGLMLTPGIQKEIMAPGQADRYGSVYTQLSREIAKWVNDPARLKARNLFVPYDEALFGQSAPVDPYLEAGYERTLEDEGRAGVVEEQVRRALATMETEGPDEAAGILLMLAKDVVTRQEYDSALAVTDREINLKGYACFDVASYYLQSAVTPTDSAGVVPYEENGVSMLKKSYGGNTFLLREPIRFNGVTLPKGSLMSKSNGAWFFQRLTPFTFDTPDGVAATGSEIEKVRVNHRAVQIGLGGFSLRHLEDGAQRRARFGAKQ